MHFSAAVQITQLQRQQLGRQPPLLLLESLVAARGGGLPLQMPDLLFDLVAQILQTLEILAGVGDAALGLLAALLVTRDAGRLLDEGAHVIGLRLDDTRDHALLDDRVAARPQAGAEEQVA